MNQELPQLERNFFSALNQLAEPLIRAGFGNPVLWPTGTIVIEIRGRKTGRVYKVPLLATRIGDMIVVSTVRRRSEWLKNIATNPDVRYWLGGRPRKATAFVIAPGIAAQSDPLPPQARCLADLLLRQSELFGIGFAILIPHSSKTKAV